MSEQSATVDTNHAIRQIVANALTLPERLHWPVSARRAPSSAVMAHLEAAPQLAELARHLYPDTLESDDLFFDIDPSVLDPLPQWAVQLDDLLTTMITSDASVADCPEPEAMFAGVFAPLLEFAQAGLNMGEKGNDSEIVIILRAARLYLQQRLLHLSGRVLATAFHQFKHKTAPQPNRYDAFVNRLREGAIVDLLLQYPVLARLWLVELQGWQRTVERLVMHFIEDRAAIATHFPGACTPLVGLTFGLSDPHQDGRTVCRAGFSSGLTLAYKPRSVNVEVAYSKLMQTFDKILAKAGQEVLPGQGRLDILAREGHGWVAWIMPEPCHNEQALARYYHRFGQILALNQLLGIGDIHPENLIAHGEYPVQVDVEVTFRAPLQRQMLPTGDGCTEALLDSVLFTNMVPVWIEQAPGIAHDVSGWQRTDGAIAHVRHFTWHGAGTDDIALKPDNKTADSCHLPTLESSPVTPAARLMNVLDGMASVHRALAHEGIDKDQLISAIVRHGKGLPVRFVFRDTSQYVALLERLTSPSCHLSGLVRSVAISALAKALTHSKNNATPALRRLVAIECEAVQANEVPYFECRTDATWLDARGSRIDGIFLQSGLDQALSRVRDWSAESARRQGDFVLAMYAGRFNKAATPPVPMIAMRERRVIDASAQAISVLRAESARIETLLLNASLLSHDGARGWIGARPVGTTDRLQLHVLDAGLYDGLAGVALFLAMRLNTSGARSSRHLLREILLTIRQLLLLQDAPREAAQRAVGWGTGLGGIAYVLAYIQATIGDELAEQTLAQLPGITPPCPVEVSVANYDLLDGAAGLIAGFCVASQRVHDPALLNVAREWGVHLIERFDEVFSLLDQTHGASVAHGTDGLRIALSRLSDALADNGDTVESERFAMFTARMAEHLDTVMARKGDGSWCHGHAGWLATRDASEASLVSHLHKCSGTLPAQLCCGELGRIDALLVTSSSRVEVQALIARTANLIRQAARDGAYPFYLQSPQSLLPGLFTGITGVGYLCERLQQALDGQVSPCVTGIQ